MLSAQEIDAALNRFTVNSVPKPIGERRFSLLYLPFDQDGVRMRGILVPWVKRFFKSSQWFE